MTDPINKVNYIEGMIIENLDQYQRMATDFAIYPGRDSFLGVIYTALKLNGEAGEIAEKIGKVMRDNDSQLLIEHKRALLLECGDVLWYIAALAKELGYSLEEVANANLQKLSSRSVRGKLSGSGDNR